MSRPVRSNLVSPPLGDDPFMIPSPPIHRAATSPDRARIAEVYLAARHQAMPWLRAAHSDHEVRRWVAQQMLPGHEVWVTEGAAAIEAFVAISRDRLWIAHLYVEPAAHGRGYGSALVELAKTRSLGSLQLWAFQRNTRARSFYAQRGFAAVAYGDGSTNEEREPDVLYRWRRPG